MKSRRLKKKEKKKNALGATKKKKIGGGSFNYRHKCTKVHARSKTGKKKTGREKRTKLTSRRLPTILSLPCPHPHTQVFLNSTTDCLIPGILKTTKKHDLRV